MGIREFFICRIILTFIKEMVFKYYQIEENSLSNTILSWKEFQSFSPREDDVIGYEYFYE